MLIVSRTLNRQSSIQQVLCLLASDGSSTRISHQLRWKRQSAQGPLNCHPRCLNPGCHMLTSCTFFSYTYLAWHTIRCHGLDSLVALCRRLRACCARCCVIRRAPSPTASPYLGKLKLVMLLPSAAACELLLSSAVACELLLHLSAAACELLL